MLVKHLTVGTYRTYDSAEVELEPGVNLFVGDNGFGKTNLVEAIHYLATLSSHRVAGYLPLIKAGHNQAVIRAKVSHAGRDVLLEAELNRDTKNRVAINKNPSSRLADLLGYVNTVTFAPEDLDIIKKDPSNRRAFIDELVVQLTPRFSGIYADYERVLKQRNTLLKSARNVGAKGSALSTLDAWDQQLIQLGTQIVVARGQLVQRVQPHLIDAYQQIAVANNEPKILIKSSLLSAKVPSWQDEEDTEDLEYLEDFEPARVTELFVARVAALREKELERGLTLAGPQRDDLVLLLSGLPAKGYASHGESWSYALALRLAARKLLREDSNSGDPVLILDDVFAELDAGRRARLAEMVADNEQVLITAAVAEDVPSQLNATVFHVKRGSVEKAGQGVSE